MTHDCHFSAGLRLLHQREDWTGRWLSPLVALGVGLAGVLATNALLVFVLLPLGLYEVAIAGVLGAALVCVVLLRPQIKPRAVPALATWIPLAFHGYFLLAGLLSGALFDPPVLLVVSGVMSGVALRLHSPSAFPQKVR